MKSTFYYKARLKHSVWVGIALFFVVFYSCPVKKYIQIQLRQIPPTNVPSTIAQNTNNVNKICNINRHALSQKVILAHMQHNADFDLDILLLLSSLLSFLGLLYLRDDRNRKKQHQPAPPNGLIPIYLQIRKLQV